MRSAAFYIILSFFIAINCSGRAIARVSDFSGDKVSCVSKRSAVSRHATPAAAKELKKLSRSLGKKKIKKRGREASELSLGKSCFFCEFRFKEISCGSVIKPLIHFPFLIPQHRGPPQQ